MDSVRLESGGRRKPRLAFGSMCNFRLDLEAGGEPWLISWAMALKTSFFGKRARSDSSAGTAFYLETSGCLVYVSWDRAYPGLGCTRDFGIPGRCGRAYHGPIVGEGSDDVLFGQACAGGLISRHAFDFATSLGAARGTTSSVRGRVGNPQKGVAPKGAGGQNSGNRLHQWSKRGLLFWNLSEKTWGFAPHTF